jgi:hypothetical protein
MNKRGIATFFASALLLAATSNVQASTTIDFTIPGSPATMVGSGYGNALDFGGLTVTAWATTGQPNSNIEDAQIDRFGTGLGVCNRSEGINCSDPAHQVDNFGDDDYVLFLFDQQVDFESIVIDPFNTWDRDVSFWVANITGFGMLPGMNPADLDPISGNTNQNGPTNSADFPFYNKKNASPSSNPKTFNLSNALGGSTGNALLFAARADAGDKKDNDRFKISSLTYTAVVPVPAAVWLFGSGLLGLVGVARRKTS